MEVDDYLYFRDCTFGHLQNINYFSEIPLDNYTLNKLSECQINFMVMIGRYEKYENLILYNVRLKLYHKLLKYFLNYLILNDVNLVIFLVHPHVGFDYIIYCLCKFLGIKTIIIYRTTILKNENVSVYSYNCIKEHMGYKIDDYICENYQLSDRV
ncbi:hypothetical protein N9A58_03385, partial [Opitutales bacterium]|nr:hypothetical protein [Opitutales bacterium]